MDIWYKLGPHSKQALFEEYSIQLEKKSRSSPWRYEIFKWSNRVGRASPFKYTLKQAKQAAIKRLLPLIKATMAMYSTHQSVLEQEIKR